VTVVVDASIAAAWVLPDEQNADANAVLLRLNATGDVIPTLFWYEALNLCLLAERRRRIRIGEACHGRLRQLNLHVRDMEDDHVLLSIALKHRLSAYDAAYLAMAVGQNLPLATSDRRLATAARTEAIVILGPLSNPL
jgi:predicted nucleic acid-binding protein